MHSTLICSYNKHHPFLKTIQFTAQKSCFPFRISLVNMINFFHLVFLSQTFMNHRTAGEGGGHFFNSSLPLSLASKVFWCFLEVKNGNIDQKCVKEFSKTYYKCLKKTIYTKATLIFNFRKYYSQTCTQFSYHLTFQVSVQNITPVTFHDLRHVSVGVSKPST